MPCLNYLSRDAIRELYQEIHNFPALLVYHDSYLNDSYLPLVTDTIKFHILWLLTGKKKLDEKEVQLVKEQVTTLFVIRMDDNIRMIDYNEFFYRAAGNIVSVLDTKCYVLHYHNWFDRHYQKYRLDYSGDVRYIREKIRRNRSKQKYVGKEIICDLFYLHI